jgi:hypothetical protein
MILKTTIDDALDIDGGDRWIVFVTRASALRVAQR